MQQQVTGSDGSSSMATVCAASLAAAEAEVPMLAQVAGVAIGAYIQPDDQQSSNANAKAKANANANANANGNKAEQGWTASLRSLFQPNANANANASANANANESADANWTTLDRDQEFVLLTDILGMEDHFGDMDFKIAGTAEGITAAQMDCSAPVRDRQTVPPFVCAVFVFAFALTNKRSAEM